MSERMMKTERQLVLIQTENGYLIRNINDDGWYMIPFPDGKTLDDLTDDVGRLVMDRSGDVQ